MSIFSILPAWLNSTSDSFKKIFETMQITNKYLEIMEKNTECTEKFSMDFIVNNNSIIDIEKTPLQTQSDINVLKVDILKIIPKENIKVPLNIKTNVLQNEILKNDITIPVNYIPEANIRFFINKNNFQFITNSNVEIHCRITNT